MACQNYFVPLLSLMVLLLQEFLPVLPCSLLLAQLPW